MLCVVTTVHDPAALTATCRRLGLPPPVESSHRYGDREASGWVVRLPGLHSPVVCDTLRGLVAYDAHDNVPGRYGRLMHLIHRYDDVRAQRQRDGGRPDSHPAGARERRLVAVGEGA